MRAPPSPHPARCSLLALASVLGVAALRCAPHPPAPSDATGPARDATSAFPDSDAAPALPDAAALDAPADMPDAPAAPDASSDDSGVSAAERQSRADLALQALLRNYWNGPAANLDAHDPSDGSATGYWTYAQALDAVLDGIERYDRRRYTAWLRTLYDAQSARGFTRDYFDDENWMALAMLRAFDLSGDRMYLDRARALFADIMTAAPDSTCCGAHPGGLWWDRPHTQKATAINAGAVVTGVRLFRATGDATYRDFARRVYQFWFDTMVDPTTWQVTDHVDRDGTPVRWRFTYNEGLMIGAAVELFRATSDTTFLEQARQIAGFVLAHETVATPYGRVLFDGTAATCGADCAQFKGIGFRYLALLVQNDPSGPQTPAFRDVLRASAEAIWRTARDASSGHFGVDWSAGPPRAPTLINQDSSAAMALAVIARLEAGVAPAPPPDVYEAEEGALHGVGLEAAHGAFAGWGYLAGWNRDGQWVDFDVTAPAAGRYVLAFRYSAGAGDASRYVFVNGRGAVDNLALRATASWDAYTTVETTVSLGSGSNTVSLIYNGAMGSRNYVNLDQLAVRPAP